MKVYPIHVPRKQYRGSKQSTRQRAAEYNRDAMRLENYLNDHIRANPAAVQQYLYGFIASDLGLASDRVREILFGVDCGHNGLTVAKSEEALQAFLKNSDGATTA
jgi:hypothetical protein